MIEGDARLLRLTFLAAFGAWSLVVSAGAVFRPNPTDVEMILLLVSFLAVFVPVVVSLFGLVRATVTLDDTSIVVRALGGAVRRDLQRPFRLTTGRLVERRSTVGVPVDSDSRGYDANAGTYLRLANEAGSITIGSRAGGIGKRWAAGGWEKGGVLRTWDVTVDRRDVVAIEYFLAWCRQIRPRSRPHEGDASTRVEKGRSGR